jgi:hypothetical protein
MELIVSTPSRPFPVTTFSERVEDCFRTTGNGAAGSRRLDCECDCGVPRVPGRSDETEIGWFGILSGVLKGRPCCARIHGEGATTEKYWYNMMPQKSRRDF